MARYIDVDKFLKSMITKFKCVPLLGVSKYINGEECFEGEHLNSLINETPTADVQEVRHGKWEKRKECCCEYRCSVCEYELCRTTNYCPNCGAKMDEEEQK